MNDLFTSDGELRTSGEVIFRVRPLSGPGTKGPYEITPESEAVLEEVRAVLEKHPQLRLRIECAINPMRMGNIPDPAMGAHLAHMVARSLVNRGVECRRLEPIGWLDSAEAPGQKVRFFEPGRGPERPAGARADACSTQSVFR